MKIEYTNGCTGYSLNVDGVETADMDKQDVKNVIKKLVDTEKDLGVLQMLLEYLMESQGEYKDLGQCETCGDYITRYTLEV